MDALISNSELLLHEAHHIFLPPQSPWVQLDGTPNLINAVDIQITRSIIAAVSKYKEHDAQSASQWDSVVRMMTKFSRTITHPLQQDQLSQDMSSMELNDLLIVHVKTQNAAIFIRKLSDTTIFEVFEVQAPNAEIMSISGKLVRHYPGSTVELPNTIANDLDFTNEVANFLAQMRIGFPELDSGNEAASLWARVRSSNVAAEMQDARDPSRFVQLFTGILRGMGKTINPPRIVKRIADEVCWNNNNTRLPWRRSSTWLIIRLALQTFLGSTILYKHFMVFFHAEVLSGYRDHEIFTSDLLYALRVKVAKRAFKVKGSIPSFVAEKVKMVVDGVQELLEKRWSNTQAEQWYSLNWPTDDLQTAFTQSLPNSRTYLEGRFQNQASPSRQGSFEPYERPRLENIADFSEYTNGALVEAFSDQGHVALYDFENSVFEHLSRWTDDRCSSALGACRALSSCFKQYQALAKPHYASDTPSQSIMILTLVRIWKAIDELATRECPLLLDFPTGLPDGLLDPLLLRTRQHIQAARTVQQHLHTRCKNAAPGTSPPWLNNGSVGSFAVRYFRQSPTLQATKSSIEAVAAQRRQEKIEELERKNQEYYKLVETTSVIHHSYEQRDLTRPWKREHAEPCTRCEMEKSLKGMTMYAYVWPLPTDQLEGETLVFELQRPDVLAIWRDITYGVVYDLGTTLEDPPSRLEGLKEVADDLRPWYPEREAARLAMMLSVNTDRNTSVSLPAKIESICISRVWNYRLIDRTWGCLVQKILEPPRFTRYGTLLLPYASAYKHLQYALTSTKHTSNHVLADQFNCPKELSPHEHVAFGTLRSGPRLQWMNIARGLEEDILTFSSHEVYLLHVQAAWQLGPLNDDGGHEWHRDLDDPAYGELLVKQSLRLLRRVKRNWLEGVSVATIVMLVNRLLVSSRDNGVLTSAHEFLREARGVVFSWLLEMQRRIQDADDKAMIADYRIRLCEMATICRSTFAIDSGQLPAVLSSPESLSILIRSSISLHENSSTMTEDENLPEYLQMCLRSDRRLSHRTLPILIQQVRADKHILCRPIHELWSDYICAGGWAEFFPPDERWVSTTTGGSPGQARQGVHLNLLEGRLLVDGRPLGKLPEHYMQHPTYTRVFGQTMFDVVPAKLASGMEFSTLDRVKGCQVLFQLHGIELIIQVHKDGASFQLIPFSQFEGDLPEVLIHDYHHWACLETKTVSFCPLSDPWWSIKQQWVMEFPTASGSSDRTTLRRTTDESQLIDMHCSIFRFISDQLSPLESPQHLLVTLSKSPNMEIRVELPRMQLSFFVNENTQIESTNFHGRIVDRSQSFGALVGLQNKLVLCAKDPEARSLPRSQSVLIPFGPVQVTRSNHHVSASVKSPDSGNECIQFYRYWVDTSLGSLVDDGSLTGRLYRIYLHAITSHCLPDPLTGKTGTEEALCALSESATSSFPHLDSPQMDLLRLIGSLTPNHRYHDFGRRSFPPSVQRTEWWFDALSPLSQHFGFSTAVSAIFDRANSLQMFYPTAASNQERAPERNANLLRRAAIRTHFYYAPGTPHFLDMQSDEPHLQDGVYAGHKVTRSDQIYKAGDLAAWTAQLVLKNWNQAIYKQLKLASLAEHWSYLPSSHDNLTLAWTPDWLSIDLSTTWITIYNLCRHAHKDSNKFGLVTCLASMAFSGKVSTGLVPVFVAFAANDAFATLDPPNFPLFRLGDKYRPTLENTIRIVSRSALDHSDTPAARLCEEGEDDGLESLERAIEYHKEQIKDRGSRFAQTLLGQWPSTDLQPLEGCSDWFQIDTCLDDVREYFLSCKRNVELRGHLLAVEKELSACPQSRGISFKNRAVPRTPSDPEITVPPRKGIWSKRSIQYLTTIRECPEATTHVASMKFPPKNGTSSLETGVLASLLSELEQSPDDLTYKYGQGLKQSQEALSKKSVPIQPNQLPSQSDLDNSCQTRGSALSSRFNLLQHYLGPATLIEDILFVCGLWPRVTPRNILQQLSLDARVKYCSSCHWQTVFVEYACLFIAYQQSQRLFSLSLSCQREEFWQEAETVNIPIDRSNPDWLLVQIEGNFRARPLQYEVARKMISPSSDPNTPSSNTVLQLNMGEGKSSVIVPMIAASLANTQQLVRVVVLKPLWRQMFRLLVNRLGGLLNRRIYYLPMGRHIEPSDINTMELEKMYDECMRGGGVLLAQPEHILSSRLMGIDRLISEQPQTGQRLRKLHKWLETHTRDVLDESDEILHPRYRLIYTMGEQQPLENHPDRWLTTQELLNLVAKHISRLQRVHPETFVSDSPMDDGQFPIIRILPDGSEESKYQLLRDLANDILEGSVENLSRAHLPENLHRQTRAFLTTKNIQLSDYNTLRSKFNDNVWYGLLLTRGLLALGIVRFALERKRYRVDYGLDFRRSQLAVPFHAKDTPSPRAEFGHPDVTLVLTCLSYYYQGLTKTQLYECFELLFRLDNPSIEYERWVSHNGRVLENLQLQSINVKNHDHFSQEVFPRFSHKRVVINFYLSRVVFPQAAKEYSHRLTASGWDLAEAKPRVTTGFSGTNDNRYLLPLSIRQDEPLERLETNALGLAYLLQPENNSYMEMFDTNRKAISTQELLRKLTTESPKIRALFDVGAQMLELRNQELVQCWLKQVEKSDTDIQAAVFFNDSDELMVLSRSGVVTLLNSSPFAHQLDNCLVYLDDGHTRGTDLKFPRNTRALVTLGPTVTKDRLLQGCMRLRKLGHGQSVMFAAPLEVDKQIRRESANAGTPMDAQVVSRDVLRWAMKITCQDLQRCIPLWAQQGVDYKQRSDAWSRFNASLDVKFLKKGWLAPEARALEDMYGTRSTSSHNYSLDHLKRSLTGDNLHERLDNLGIEGMGEFDMDEEQEREVSQEVDREKERIARYWMKPSNHSVHKDIRNFVDTGSIAPGSQAITSVFSLLTGPDTQAMNQWPKKLLATKDFLYPLADPEANGCGSYMRPVNWVMINESGLRVVLSPYEVNELLPAIRQSKVISLHVYAPRVNRSMQPFSDLQFYSLPRQLASRSLNARSLIQIYLDIFAGQLYLRDYDEYVMLCVLLGLATPATRRQQSIRPDPDGFFKPELRRELFKYHPQYAICKFTESQIPTLKNLFQNRRGGMNFALTQMGRVLHGQVLTDTPKDFPTDLE